MESHFSGPGGGELPAALGVGMLIVVAIAALIGLALLVFVVICWAKVFGKAGYSKLLCLLIFIPFGELIMLCIMAFGNWPALKELARLKQLQNQPRQ